MGWVGLGLVGSSASSWVHINPHHSQSWCRLGSSLMPFMECVAVSGKSYTQCECYIKAIEVDPNMPLGWLLLGRSLILFQCVEIDNRSFGAKECCVRALEIDPRNIEHAAWGI